MERRYRYQKGYTVRRYTKEELSKYWMGRCPDCGWRGLSIDCNGCDSIGENGDYSDPMCPRCGGVAEFGESYGLACRIKWLWRWLTVYPLRSRIKREASELAYVMSYGHEPKMPTSMIECVVLGRAKAILDEVRSEQP